MKVENGFGLHPSYQLGPYKAQISKLELISHQTLPNALKTQPHPDTCMCTCSIAHTF